MSNSIEVNNNIEEDDDIKINSNLRDPIPLDQQACVEEEFEDQEDQEDN